MRSFFFKMLMISVLAVVLFVAGTMVRGVVADRMMNREVARQSISEGLAERQTLAGVVLRVSYTEHWQRPVTDKDGRVLRQEACSQRHETLLLPETLNLTGSLISDPRQRGIFHINAYVLSGRLTGTLKLPALAELSRSQTDSSVVIDSAEAVLAVSDPRGLRKAELKVAGQALALEPGTGLNGARDGAHATLNDAGALAGKILPFELALDLAGTDSFSMVPLGRNTSAQLNSRWPHPSFGVYRYFKPPFPRSARAAASREAVNRVVFGDNPPLSMTIHPLNRPESPRFDAI